MIAQVAVLLPVAGGAYSYEVPPDLAVAVGTRVWVPFSGRGVEGVVVELGDTAGADAPRRLKRITRVLDAPPLDGELVELGRWVAWYYMAPLGEAMRLCLPPGGKATETRRVALTDAGRALAATIGGALDPPALAELSARERVVLAQVAAAGGETRVTALRAAVAGGHGPATLLLLEGRGLVTRVDEVHARRESTATLVRAVDGAAAASPGRAPRRTALLERVRAAGEIALADLRAVDARATEQIRALAAAGLVTTREVPIDHRGPFSDGDGSATPPSLNDDQRAALDRLLPALDEQRYQPYLLHGVTGSGKTEVYLHVIAAALERGRGALVLVPEIALTPQLASRFRARFGDQVAVLHSGLSDRERFGAWVRLRDGRMRIALGARSAVFAPVARLGVIVVDEEHDGSFKQEEGVRYHGRDVALRRARSAGCLALLGSATPSLEVYEATRTGRVARLELPRRATPRPLPTVEIVDLRQHKTGPDGLLTAVLADAITATLAAGEQVILFLNRRGFATFVLCKACGHRFRCQDCSVSLTYHRSHQHLVCHYCGYLEAPQTICPRCRVDAVARLGLGTERMATLLVERFPGARVARLDRDTATGQGIEHILDEVRAHKVDILVGTQMIAKGHDFPGVTLVGVILADQSMGFPDFRASERTFQLLEQVAGRAGRGERPGRVVIQTFAPGHPAVQRAQDHDYARFFVEEMAERQDPAYPPFVRLALVRIDGPDVTAVRLAAEAAAAAARAVLETAPPTALIELRGPSEAPLGRLKGRTRWHLLIKAAAAEPRALRAVLEAIAASPVPAGVRLVIDVDPVSSL